MLGRSDWIKTRHPTDISLPAFLSRPPDAPVYHGFPILKESLTDDGWCFGAISDPNNPEGADWGDAFVVAPDNSRAGLVWQTDISRFETILEPSTIRWGVYAIPVTKLIRNESELIAELREWLPELQKRHAAWTASLETESKPTDGVRGEVATT